MTNEKKLELTLCGMFSYKLKIECDNTIWTLDKLDRPYKTNDKLFLNIGCRYDEKGFPLTQKSFISGKYEFKPLLHSLHKLTENILDEENDYFYQLNCDLCEILEINSCEYFVKSLISDSKYVISTRKMIEALEWLKEHHFNIYNLPSEMYIEKSTVKI